MYNTRGIVSENASSPLTIPIRLVVRQPFGDGHGELSRTDLIDQFWCSLADCFDPLDIAGT
jgi:hypothetical protein